MVRIVVSTNDMRFYYHVASYLKEREISFESMKIGERIPFREVLVITTDREAELINHPRVYSSSEPVLAARKAIEAMKSERKYRELVIGIDPGKSIGIAVVGDGRVLNAGAMTSIEKVRDEIDFYLNTYRFDEAIIRIGDGDSTIRNRIISELWPLGLEIQMVAEESIDIMKRKAGEFSGRRKERSDIGAAIGISMKQGITVEKKPDPRPTDGELREIQRRSRLASNGRITIARRLARKVALGEMEMEMERAIEEQGT